LAHLGGKTQKTEKPKERGTKDMAPRKRKLCGPQVTPSGVHGHTDHSKLNKKNQ
jgi:hypothetical protein